MQLSPGSQAPGTSMQAQPAWLHAPVSGSSELVEDEVVGSPSPSPDSVAVPESVPIVSPKVSPSPPPLQLARTSNKHELERRRSLAMIE